MVQRASNPNNGRVLNALVASGIGAVTGWIGTAMYLWQWSFNDCVVAITHGDITPGGYYLPAVGGVVGGLAAGGLAFKWFTRPHEIHHRGRRLRSPSYARRKLRPRWRQMPSIALPGKITLPIEQETRHFLVAGSSGGGKTTIIYPMMIRAGMRGDRLLIFSFKNDFQEIWPAGFHLLAPWDSRSSTWIMGEDIQTRADALALAETLIPLPDKDPIWAQGAQSLLLGVILSCQSARPGEWTATDLAQRLVAVCANFAELSAIMEAENPTALMYLKGGETSKTTASFLSNFAAAIEPVIDLGVAQNTEGKPEGKVAQWSVRRWLSDANTLKTAIIGYSTTNKRLSECFAAAIVELATRQILEMPDVTPATRRVWFFLDEVPQMGKVPSITQALETGQSKGLRLVLGIQSVAQLRSVYGKDTATIWESLTATKLLVQINGAEDQKWASELLGEREIERFSSSQQKQTTQGNAGHSDTYQHVREPVLLPVQFASDLGPYKSPLSRGVHCLVLHGDVAAVVQQPFWDKKKVRSSVSAADWTKPGYKRPLFGRIPPIIDVMTESTEEKQVGVARETPHNEAEVHDYVNLVEGAESVHFSALAQKMLGNLVYHGASALMDEEEE